MNNEEILKKIEELNQKTDEVAKHVKQMKNYFKWMLIITVALFVVPLIGLMFVIPSYLQTLNTVTSF